MKNSISQIIKNVLADEGNEFGTLHESLIVALERAGIYTDNDPWDGVHQPLITSQIGGVATVHIETRHDEGEKYGVADVAVIARAFFTPHYEDIKGEHVLTHYDVVLSGQTTPLHGKTHLYLKSVDPEQNGTTT